MKELTTLLKAVWESITDNTQKTVLLVFFAFLVFLSVIAGKMPQDNPSIYGIMVFASLLAFVAFIFVAWLLVKYASAQAQNGSEFQQRIAEISKEWDQKQSK
jgi:vacuolar-type H+-ATPase subunit I/STV1